MLRNKTGSRKDAMSIEYDGGAVFTEYGIQLPYLNGLIDTVFDVKHLKSARIFSAKNGFIVPHRDYIEFKKGFTRIHLVLKTNDQAMNSEGQIVYHMCKGELWFLDGTIAHSGGCFCAEKRLHLVLDFDPDVAIKDLFNDTAAYQTGLTPTLIQRPMFSDEDREELVCTLSGVISQLNFDSVFHLVSKLHFDKELDCTDRA